MRQSLRIAMAAAGIQLLTACADNNGLGSGDDASEDAPADGPSPEGASSDAGDAGDASPADAGPQSIYGTWVLPFADPTGYLILTLSTNSSFQLTLLEPTSGTTSDEQIWFGTFAASGSTVTFTTQKWSCSGPGTLSPTPYSFDNQSHLLLMDVAFPSSAPGVLLPWSATSASEVPGSSLAPMIGCFVNGLFVTAPVAPVIN